MIKEEESQDFKILIPIFFSVRLVYRNAKEKVRKIQDANRKKKEEEKERLKEKSMEGMRRKQAMAAYSQNDEGDGENDKDDDDAEWYRKEVGQEPEKG